MQQIIKLYHGTTKNFNNFNEKYLGGNIQDLLSYLGFHFTDNYNIAENFFAFDYKNLTNGQVLTIEYEYNNIIEINEVDLIFDMLELGYLKGLVSKQIIGKLKKIPYIGNNGKNIVSYLYNSGKRKNGIPLELISSNYKKELQKKGIDIIRYKNMVEWRDENRYDYILLNTNNIKII